METIQIKEGQVWQNKNKENFLVIDEIGEYNNVDYCKVQVLQDTDMYHIGEILPNVAKEQFGNMKLVEIKEYNDELKYDVKIKELLSEIKRYESDIFDLEQKVKESKNKVRKLLEQVHKINPVYNDVVELSEGVFITDDDMFEVYNKLEKERQDRIKKTIKEAKEWFELTCPRCQTKFVCTPNGVGTHAYDYLTKGGKSLEGDLRTHELHCPSCGQYNEEEKWGYKKLK